MVDLLDILEVQSNLHRNFIELVKPPISVEAVLEIEITLESQSNLEEKDNPIILKLVFTNFYQILNCEKCFLLHLKSSFRS